MSADPESADAQPREQSFDIRIVGGSPSSEEIAAVTAVLSAALEELADDDGRRERLTLTAWERSQRTFRTPLTRGGWSEFSA